MVHHPIVGEWLTYHWNCSILHILKIPSKSVHKFLNYLSLKNYISWIQKIQIVIWITPKIETFLPFTFPEISWKFHLNPSIHFELSVFKNHISWIQKIQTVIRITPKIESFLHFTLSDISWKCHRNPSISFWVICLYKLHFIDPEDPDSDPDYSQKCQNWIISSFHLSRHILKISLKSIHKFLSYLSLKITFHGSTRSR